MASAIFVWHLLFPEGLFSRVVVTLTQGAIPTFLSQSESGLEHPIPSGNGLAMGILNVKFIMV